MHIRPLAGVCFEASHLTQGDQLIVGGHVFARDAENSHALRLTIDSDALKPFVRDCKTFFDEHWKHFEQSRSWFDERGVDTETVSHLLSFQRIFDRHYPMDAPVDERARQAAYVAHGKTAILSDLLQSRLAACVEYSAAAQLYLQHIGMDSHLISGEVLWKRDYEFPSEHTYLAIPQKGRDAVLIFDPANFHTDANGNKLPRIALVSHSLWERVMSEGTHNQRYVESVAVFSGERAYYGVGMGTNVLDSSFVEAPDGLAAAKPREFRKC